MLFTGRCIGIRAGKVVEGAIASISVGCGYVGMSGGGRGCSSGGRTNWNFGRAVDPRVECPGHLAAAREYV